MAVAVGLFGAWAGSHLAAAMTGLMAWCFTTGFLVHAGGTLVFGHADLDRLGAFIVVAVAGAACGRVRGSRRRRRRETAHLRDQASATVPNRV